MYNAHTNQSNFDFDASTYTNRIQLHRTILTAHKTIVLIFTTASIILYIVVQTSSITVFVYINNTIIINHYTVY